MPVSPLHLILSETTPTSSKLISLTIFIIYVCILLFPTKQIDAHTDYPNILIQLFALIPIYTFSEKFFIWNCATYPFIEQHLLILLIQSWIFLYVTNFINVKFYWNDKDILKFCIINSVTVGFMVFVVDSLMGFPSSWLTEAHVPLIEGLEGLILSWMVVLKQVAPEEALLVSGFRGKHAWFLWLAWILLWGFVINMLHFSMAYVLYSLAVRAFGFCVAIITAWVYLRYFQLKEDGSMGDEADSFAFVTFFPLSMRERVAPMLDSIYSAVQRIPGGSRLGRNRGSVEATADANHVISMDGFGGDSSTTPTNDAQDNATDLETLRKKQREAALREVQARLK